jgi:hypothetical protein
MIYEIQAEFTPGNNQIWVSFKDQDNQLIYVYPDQEVATNMLPIVQGLFPEGTNLRIIEREAQS